MGSFTFDALGKTLEDIVSSCRKDSQHLVVIALSRKMPRLLNMSNNSKECNLITSVLADDICTYTTEHAIPFILKDANATEAKFIILDDMMVTGESLNAVVQNLRSFSCHDIKFLSLYTTRKEPPQSLKQYAYPNFTSFFVKNIQERNEIIKHLSTNIAKSDLPVDMEFPILHIKVSETTSAQVYDKIKNRMFEIFLGKGYEIREEPGRRSYTAFLDGDVANGFNNDFSKIRIFESRSEVKIVAYAPNVIDDNLLESSKLFKNPRYAAIWQRILGEIDDPLDHVPDIISDEEIFNKYNISKRIRLTLAILANYMFSISTLVRHFDILDDIRLEFDIANSNLLHEDDLALISGPKIAKMFLSDIESLIRDKQESTSQWKEVKLPDTVIARNLNMMYEMATSLSTHNAETPASVVQKIFSIGYKLRSSSSDTPILESFKSLFKYRRNLFGEYGVLRLNRIVDQMIDEGVCNTYIL